MGQGYLDHELSNDPMKYSIVVVAILRMCDEILDSFGSGVREDSNMNIAIGRV